MKKFLLIGVTYNSYDCLREFVKSADRAARQVTDRMQVVLLIGDGSTEKENFRPECDSLECIKFDFENSGYFGGADKCLEMYGMDKVREFDFVAVSNVDQVFAEDFFTKLLDLDVPDNVGWIVPRIYTPARDREENPMRLGRYSKRDLKINILIDKYPLLDTLYNKTLRKLVYGVRHKQTTTVTQSKRIYAGCGAFFLFNKSFAAKVLPLKFPCFLYGEEIFIAEQALQYGKEVVFYPELYIEVLGGNVSTSKISKKRRNGYKIKALEYVIDRFYDKK